MKGTGKDVEHHYSSVKCKEKPKWDIAVWTLEHPN